MQLPYVLLQRYFENFVSKYINNYCKFRLVKRYGKQLVTLRFLFGIKTIMFRKTKDRRFHKVCDYGRKNDICTVSLQHSML